MRIRRRVRRRIRITVLTLFILAILVCAGALPFTKTQFFLLRAFNLRKTRGKKAEKCEQFVEKHPTYIPAKIKLARYYLILGLRYPEKPKYFDSGIKQCEAALDIDSCNKDAIALLGDIYTHKGDLKKAEEFYKQLIEIEPENSEFFLKLALNYYNQDMKEKLLTEAQSLIKQTPENAMAHLFLAQLYEEQGGFAEAIAEYKESIGYFELQKQTRWLVDAYYRLANLYYKVGLFFDAVGQLEKAIEVAPKQFAAYLALADMYSRLGLADKSLSTMEPALKMQIKISNQQRVRAYLILGSAYLKKSDFIAARNYIEKTKAMGVNFNQEFLERLADLAELKEEEEKQFIETLKEYRSKEEKEELKNPLKSETTTINNQGNDKD